jgi:hypothetical protein
MKTSYYISHSKQYAPASINIGYYIHHSRPYHDPLSEQKVIMSAYIGGKRVVGGMNL